jgi:hypothetical protein
MTIRLDFSDSEREAPPHDLRVEQGRCTDLAFPRTPYEDDRRVEVVLNA